MDCQRFNLRWVDILKYTSVLTVVWFLFIDSVRAGDDLCKQVMDIYNKGEQESFLLKGIRPTKQELEQVEACREGIVNARDIYHIALPNGNKETLARAIAPSSCSWDVLYKSGQCEYNNAEQPLVLAHGVGVAGTHGGEFAVGVLGERIVITSHFDGLEATHEYSKGALKTLCSYHKVGFKLKNKQQDKRCQFLNAGYIKPREWARPTEYLDLPWNKRFNSDDRYGNHHNRFELTADLDGDGVKETLTVSSDEYSASGCTGAAYGFEAIVHINGKQTEKTKRLTKTLSSYYRKFSANEPTPLTYINGRFYLIEEREETVSVYEVSKGMGYICSADIIPQYKKSKVTSTRVEVGPSF